MFKKNNRTTGLIYGPSHDQGGIGIVIKETGTNKEVEGHEYIICSTARFSKEIHEFNHMTNKEVLDAIHRWYGCHEFNPEIAAADFILCKLVVNEPAKHTRVGTVEEILNLMQGEKSCTVTNTSKDSLLHKGGPAGVIKLKCLYIQGLDALFQQEINSELSNLYDLTYPAIDYADPANIYPKFQNIVEGHNFDLIIGHSAGALIAFHLAQEYNIPCLMMCPAFGEDYNSFPPPEKIYNPKMLAILGKRDNVIDSRDQLTALRGISNCQIITEDINHDPTAKDIYLFSEIFSKYLISGKKLAKGGPAEDIDEEIINQFPRLNQKQIKDIYDNTIQLIDAGAPYSEEAKRTIEKYEGRGSQVQTGVIDEGLVHQFYTPYIVCKKMWDLALKYGFTGGNVLEPSCGTGRFYKYAPKGTNLFGFDLDDTNIKIAKALYPGALLYKQEFETAFLQQPNYSKAIKKSWLPEMDLVIGNPPYGDYLGYFKTYMPAVYKRFEFLFIRLGLQALKPGGLLVYIISQNLMNNGSMYNKMKADILELGTFVDAIRLPNGIFASTQVGTDIVIFKRK